MEDEVKPGFGIIFDHGVNLGSKINEKSVRLFKPGKNVFDLPIARPSQAMHLKNFPILTGHQRAHAKANK
jgi:hypothetical protein